MADGKEMQAVQTRVQRRVELSAPLLEGIGVPVEVYQRTVLNAFVLQPALADCTPASIDAAIMRAINARLMPDGREAAIVAFKGQATFIPMIDGQVKLAHQATRGLSLRTRVVYAADDFEYSEGLYPVLRHTPAPQGSRTEEDVVAVYAVARATAGSEPVYEVMLRGDIDRHRGYSPSRGRGPWDTHYQQMAEKTVLRRLLRRLPQPAGYSSAPEYPDIEMHGYGVDAVAAPVVEGDSGTAPIPPIDLAAQPATGDEVTLEYLPEADTPPADAPAEDEAAPPQDAPF